MFGLPFIRPKYILMIFLNTSVILFNTHNSHIQAACRGEGFMGISSKDPIMSWVDLSFSPMYTSSSTSGTSGCKNWEFTHYLDYERNQFIKKSHQHLLVETSRGRGPHLEALSRLMECPQTPLFASMLWEHRVEAFEFFETINQTQAFIEELSKWIKEDPKLRNICGLS